MFSAQPWHNSRESPDYIGCAPHECDAMEKQWEGRVNDEIEGLEETYHWAREVSVTRFSERIASLASRPMFAVGSGGSLTTAEIATALFHEFDHGFSSALTPLELASRRGVLRSSSVFLASAAGSNPDIIGALRIAAENEAEQVLALCTSLNSRIAQEADKYSNVEVEAFEVPAGRDGFLATRSLFVSAILLARAFCESNGVSPRLPAGLSTLVGRQRWQSFVDSVVQRSTSSLGTRDAHRALWTISASRRSRSGIQAYGGRSFQLLGR